MAGEWLRGLVFWVLWPPLALLMLAAFAVTFLSSVALGGVIHALRAVDRWTSPPDARRLERRET